MSGTLQMGQKSPLVLSASSSFTERSKLSQWHGVIQLNTVLRVCARLLHFLTTCDERCVPNTSPAPTAASATCSPLLEPFLGTRTVYGRAKWNADPGLNCCKAEWTLGDSIGQESACFLLFMLSFYLQAVFPSLLNKTHLPFTYLTGAPDAHF